MVSTNSNTYIPSTSVSGTLYYYVVVTGSCGTVTSAIATVVTNATTAINTQPGGATYCQAVTPSDLSVTASGTGTLTYQWYSNTGNSNTSGTLISGATASAYTPSTATVGTLYYYVVVNGTCGTVTSSTASVVVNALTAISSQPAGATYCQNATATALSVTASGTSPFTYQWYKNAANNNTGGTLISGATAATYTPSTTTAGTLYYYAIVNGTCGAATSNTAAIVTNVTSAISSQPSGATYCQNATASALSVTATGTSLTYQWYSNVSNSNSAGTLINGATASTYVPTTGSTGTLYYYVVVTGTCGNVTSNTATVIVNVPTSISTQPIGSTYCQNATASALSVSATGTSLTYQWYSNTVDNNTGGSLINGATTSSYTPSTVNAGTVYYYAIVNGTCGSATSATATIMINASTIISSQPAGATYCQSASATALSVAASGTNVSYQWYSNSLNNNTNGTIISGATASTFTPSTATAGTVYYYAIVNGTCGSVPSSTATIIVNPPTVIAAQPSGATYCQSATPATLSVSATGTGLTYQWYRNTANSTSGGTAVGTNSSSYTPSTAAAGTLYYYVIINGTCGTATSNTAAIIVQRTTAINTQPTGATYCQSAPASALSITASGASLTYQWYSNTANSNSGGTPVGAGGNTYTPSTTSAGTLYYYVTVTGSCGTVTSNTASVVVNTPTSISVHPSTVATNVCKDASAGSLSVTATGTGLSYQWYSNTANNNTGGTLIGAATTSVYTPSTSAAGTLYYYVQVTGTCAPTTVTSQVSGAITVAPAPDASFTVAPDSVCSGTSANIMVASTTGGILTYTTQENGMGTQVHQVSIPASASVTLTDLVTTPTVFTLTNITGPAPTNCVTPLNSAITIGVYAQPEVAPITGSNLPVASGRTVTLSDVTTGGTWLSSNPSVLSIVGSANTPSPARARVQGVSVGTSVITYTTAPNSRGCVNTAQLMVQVYDAENVRYRTTGDGNWSTVGWEKTANNGSTWNPSAAPDGNSTNVEVRHHITLDVNYTGNENASLVVSGMGGTDAVFEIAPNRYLSSDGGVSFGSKSVIVQSTLAGTGAIGKIADGGITGADKVTVQRFIGNEANLSGKRAWRLITSPVTGVTINDSWQEGLVSTSNPPVVGDPNFGTLITGSQQHTADSAFSHGYDFWSAIANNATSIRYYSAGTPSGSWNVLPDPGLKNLNIESYPAYMLFVRGNRSKLNTGIGTTTLRATGTLKQGAQPAITVPAATAYTFVGNPYASPLDLEKVYQGSRGIRHSFLIWNSSLGNYGSYQLIDGSGGPGHYTLVPVPFDNNVSTDYQFIPSSQGFFVQPDGSGDGVVNIDESVKAPTLTATTLINPYRENAYLDKKLFVNLNLKNTNNTTTLADGVLARFDAAYSAGIDEDDAVKQPNFNENLGISSFSKDLITEARPDVTKTDTVQLKMWNVSKRAYQLQLKTERFDTLALLHAWLEDSYLKTKQEISLSGSITTVNFSVTADAASSLADRFRIVFQNQSAVLPVTLTSVKATPQNSGVNVQWTVSNEVNMKGYTVERSTDGGRTYAAIAEQTAKNASGAAAGSYSSFDALPQKGENLYRIRMRRKRRSRNVFLCRESNDGRREERHTDYDLSQSCEGRQGEPSAEQPVRRQVPGESLQCRRTECIQQEDNHQPRQQRAERTAHHGQPAGTGQLPAETDRQQRHLCV